MVRQEENKEIWGKMPQQRKSMNNFKIIFLGFLFTFATAWAGLVVAPSIYYGLEAQAMTDLPTETAEVARGAEVYAANGCVYCHSQQVRPESFGSDVERGWGSRRTISEDYQGDTRALMGTMRTGPDLANVGQRLATRDWHFQHLWDPRSLHERSTMPAYRHLFEKVEVTGEPDPDALKLGEGGSAVIAGDEGNYQIVPTDEGRALVEYLLSLKKGED
jgi:cytochrome c oxidase cbb3-type subunit 2